MLSLGIPPDVVAQVDSSNSDGCDLFIVGISVWVYIGGFDEIVVIDQSLGLSPEKIVVSPVAAAHLHFVQMGKHANLVETLVMAPDDERDFHFHRDLDGENRLTRETVPVNTATAPKSGPGDTLDAVWINHLGHNIAVHDRAEPGKIPHTHRSIIMLVVSNEQRIQPKPFLYRMDDEKTVPRTGDRHHAVVVLTASAAVALDELLEFFPTRFPIQPVFLLVHSASTANPFFVYDKTERM
jgi:hypothetical protein